MNTSTRIEDLLPANPVRGRRGNPSVVPLPPGVCSAEQNQGGDYAWPEPLDEDDFPTFVCGGGI